MTAQEIRQLPPDERKALLEAAVEQAVADGLYADDEGLPSAESEHSRALRDAAREYQTKEEGETDEQFKDRRRFCEGKLIGLTIGMDEHPEFMNELPCACDSCCDCG